MNYSYKHTLIKFKSYNNKLNIFYTVKIQNKHELDLIQKKNKIESNQKYKKYNINKDDILYSINGFKINILDDFNKIKKNKLCLVFINKKNIMLY